jgi:hypothetical protein
MNVGFSLMCAAGSPRAAGDELQQPLLYKAPLSPSTGQPNTDAATMLQRKSTGGAAIASIVALGSAGDFVVCGYVKGVFTDTVSTGLKAGGEKDIFVSRYNANLQEVWTVQVCVYDVVATKMFVRTNFCMHLYWLRCPLLSAVISVPRYCCSAKLCATSSLLFSTITGSSVDKKNAFD